MEKSCYIFDERGLRLLIPSPTGMNWIRLDVGDLPIRLVIPYAFLTGRLRIFILFDKEGSGSPRESADRYWHVRSQSDLIDNSLPQAVDWFKTGRAERGYGRLEKHGEPESDNPEDLFRWASDCALGLKSTVPKIFEGFD
jgi:hypothetical protein